MEQRKSLEQQLFTWEQWNEGAEVTDTVFYDCTLTVQVGDFPAGTKFPTAYLAGSGSFVVFQDEAKQEHIFDLTLTVGRKLTIEDFPHEEGCGCGHDHD